jgi:hypothetical protein
MDMHVREKFSKLHEKPCLRPTGMLLNLPRMPASFSASSQALAFSLVMIRKMLSGSACCTSVCEVTAQRTGMGVRAGCSSLTTGGTNVETDTDDSVAKESVDPLALLIGDQPFCATLVVFVRVGFATEVALKGCQWLGGTKGQLRLTVKSPSVETE